MVGTRRGAAEVTRREERLAADVDHSGPDTDQQDLRQFEDDFADESHAADLLDGGSGLTEPQQVGRTFSPADRHIEEGSLDFAIGPPHSDRLVVPLEQLTRDAEEEGRPASAVDVDPLAQTPLRGIEQLDSELALPSTLLEEDALDTEATRIEQRDAISNANTAAITGGARIVVVEGADIGKHARLGDTELTIGRGLDNHFVLADIAVSRRHTSILATDGRFLLTDLSSGNGTLVNNVRVETHVLQHGDQIEVGNTVLRFEDPEGIEALSGAPTMVASAEQLEREAEDRAAASNGTNDGVEQAASDLDDRPRSVSGAVDVLPVAPAVVTARELAMPKSGLSQRQRRLLIVGSAGVVALLGGMLALKLIMSRGSDKQQRPHADPTELAAQHFDKGRRYFNAREWEKAREHYLKVFALAPGFDEAKRYAAQAEAEIRARDALRAARHLLDQKDYQAARRKLATLPSTSVYAASVPAVKQQIDDEEVDALMASALQLRDKGDVPEALAEVERARVISPTRDKVVALYQELKHGTTKSKGTTRRRTVSRSAQTAPRTIQPTESSTRRDTSQRSASPRLNTAIALYRKKDWSAAANAADAAATNLKGTQRQHAELMAASMRAVGQAYDAAIELQSRDPARAVKQLEAALRRDKKIRPGYHQAGLRSLLVKVARRMASEALASKRYEEAHRAVELLRRNGQADGQTKSIQSQLERAAMNLFTKAYAMRDRNPRQARQLWQQVIRMVPPSSPVYQKAYTWLNNATPTFQDEDEN